MMSLATSVTSKESGLSGSKRQTLCFDEKFLPDPELSSRFLTDFLLLHASGSCDAGVIPPRTLIGMLMTSSATSVSSRASWETSKTSDASRMARISNVLTDCLASCLSFLGGFLPVFRRVSSRESVDDVFAEF